MIEERYRQLKNLLPFADSEQLKLYDEVMDQIGCLNQQIKIKMGQKSEPATKAYLQVGRDLQDTLQANRGGCVGMAANIREGKVRMRHAGM